MYLIAILSMDLSDHIFIKSCLKYAQGKGLQNCEYCKIAEKYMSFKIGNNACGVVCKQENFLNNDFYLENCHFMGFVNKS